jgi:hypothetical protein
MPDSKPTDAEQNLHWMTRLLSVLPSGKESQALRFMLSFEAPPQKMQIFADSCPECGIKAHSGPWMRRPATLWFRCTCGHRWGVDVRGQTVEVPVQAVKPPEE